MASTPSKNGASPSTETRAPVVFTSLDELDRHLRDGTSHDVFVYEGDDREVVLRNDCRSYPLRGQATISSDATAAVVPAFVASCRGVYGVTFQSSLPGAKKSRVPEIASKIGVYAPLDTIEVHFYKDAPRDERRRIMEWLITSGREADRS